MLEIISEGKTYKEQDILNFQPDNTTSITHKIALAFCKEWLQGRETFQIQTSGSTGKPKTILLSRRQMQASAQMTARALGLKTGNNSLVCLDTRYIGGLMMLVRGMETGMKMTLVQAAANPLIHIPEDSHFDFTALVPLQLFTILKDGNAAILNKMKAILIGGAPVSLQLQKALQKVTAPVYHTYGMTETVSHIALRRLNGGDASEIFTAMDGVTLGLDNRGCLTISSEVTNGEKIITNDLVNFIDENRFLWLGRIDNIINSGGVKIKIENVERILEEILYNNLIFYRFFIAGLPDEKLGEKVCLIMEGEKLKALKEKDIKDQLKGKLSRFEVPREIFYVAKFKETATGKIQRQQTIAGIFALKRDIF